MTARIDRLVVVGVGLIGGSFALALKAAGAVGRVIGVGRSEENLARALSLGVIDAAGGLDATTLAGAELVLLAVPVGQMESVMRALVPILPLQAVVTDAGSTKGNVVALARRELGAAFARFVPGHPIAGAEKSGSGAATADLYRGRKVVLTPLAETIPQALAAVRSAWETCGAQVSLLSPEEHDLVLAAVSHLPHVLAYALVNCIARRRDGEKFFSYAAGGFRDFTRIASSSPELWRDICLANREALLAEITRYREGLDEIAARIAHGDSAALERFFAEARAARERWLPRNDR